MIKSFKDRATEDIYNGQNTAAARKTLPANLRVIAERKLTMLNRAVSLLDLRVPPGNRLEALRGDRLGQHSIRINDQYRICFVWTDEGSTYVEVTDYH